MKTDTVKSTRFCMAFAHSFLCYLVLTSTPFKDFKSEDNDTVSVEQGRLEAVTYCKAGVI